MNNFQNEILAANQVDIDNAKKSGISGPMLSRLALSTGKLQSLSAGLLQVQKTSLLK
jgi:gamma-glutamyl phosphate reductase